MSLFSALSSLLIAQVTAEDQQCQPHSAPTLRIITPRSDTDNAVGRMRRLSVNVEALLQRAKTTAGAGKQVTVTGKELETLLTELRCVTRLIASSADSKSRTPTPRSQRSSRQSGPSSKPSRRIIFLRDVVDEPPQFGLGDADPAAYKVAYRLLKQGTAVEKTALKVGLPPCEVARIDRLRLKAEQGCKEQGSSLHCSVTAPAPHPKPAADIERSEELL